MRHGHSVIAWQKPLRKVCCACSIPDSRALEIGLPGSKRGRPRRAAREACGVGKAWEAGGGGEGTSGGHSELLPASRYRGRGRQAELTTKAVIDLTGDFWIIKDRGGDCKLSSNLAKERWWRVERRLVPFLHLKCKHMMIRELFSLPTQSPTLLKTQIASITSNRCGHQCQLLIPVKKSCGYGGLIFCSQ